MKMNTVMQMQRHTFFAFALAGVSLLPGAAFAQKVWHHGMVEAKSDAGFVFMSDKGGFAEKRGIKLETVQFKGDALALRALLAGELESYEGSPGAPMVAISRGADVKVVGCYWPGLTYAIITKTEVKSPAELKGKSFAISSPGALPDLFARAVLDKYKISSSDVQFASMGSDVDRFRAVSAGIVGAAAVSSEFTPIVDKLGLKVLVHAHDVTPEYIRFCTYMSAKTIAARPDDAAKFLAASIESLRYAMKNRDAVVKLTKTLTGSKDDDPRASYVYDEVLKLSAIDPEMPIQQDKLAWMRDLFVKTGVLKAPVDLAKFIDNSVRDKALALTGPAKN